LFSLGFQPLIRRKMMFGERRMQHSYRSDALAVFLRTATGLMKMAVAHAQGGPAIQKTLTGHITHCAVLI
jgi:hypothetical protein